jgi:hypothetical protein
LKSEGFMRSLSILYQLFATTSLVPSDWSNCQLHLLIKKRNEPHTSNNTRPIALSNILRRIFEKLLLSNWISTGSSQDQMISNHQDWTLLDPGQAGFRRGYSTISQILLSDEISRRSNPLSIFLDIKGAFDNVNWMKLKNLLIERNCPATHLNLILSLMCKPANLLLSVNQSERQSIKTYKGVFQGGGISAFIFAIYIDPLARKINTNCPPYRPLGLMYADDIQLKPRNDIEAQEALDICTQYGTEYDMTWSIKKCAVVGLSDYAFILAGDIIPEADSYKYLGVIHRSNGVDFHETFVLSSQKQRARLTSLTDQNWHPKVKLTIYRTFIRPITEYTSALSWIWAHKDLSRRYNIVVTAKNLHNSAMGWIFSKRQNSKILNYISGLGSIDFRMECLRAGLSRSLSKLTPSNPLVHARSFYCLSTSSNFILPDCFTSKLWISFNALNKRKVIKTSWKTHMKNELSKIQSCDALSSKMIAYFKPISPKSMFDLPRNLFQKALNWRLNRCFVLKTCPCQANFKRSHLDCVFSSNNLYTSITNDYSYLRRKLYLKSINQAMHYTVFDHLLNSNRFDEFFSLYDALELILS